MENRRKGFDGKGVKKESKESWKVRGRWVRTKGKGKGKGRT